MSQTSLKGHVRKLVCPECGASSHLHIKVNYFTTLTLSPDQDILSIHALTADLPEPFFSCMECCAHIPIMAKIEPRTMTFFARLLMFSKDRRTR